MEVVRMIQIFCGAKLIMVHVIESPLTGHFSDIYRIFGSYIREQRKWHDWKKNCFVKC